MLDLKKTEVIKELDGGVSRSPIAVDNLDSQQLLDTEENTSCGREADQPQD